MDRDLPIWHDRVGFGLQKLGTGSTGAAGLLAELGVEAGLGATRAAVVALKVRPPAVRATWIDRLEAAAGGIPRPDWDGMMSWDDLRALRAKGHEIGSHSMTHALLPQCDDADLEREIVASRRALEERLDAPVRVFCYPNGDSDPRSRAVVERAGYDWAVGTGWRSNRPDDDPLDLGRFEMHAAHCTRRDGSFSDSRVAWRMTSFYPGLR